MAVGVHVTWKETVDQNAGAYEFKDASGGHGRFISPYDQAYANTEVLIGRCLTLTLGDLGTDIYEAGGFKEPVLNKVIRSRRDYGRILVAGPVVEGSSYALFTSAVRKSKDHNGTDLFLTDEDWADIGFEGRNIDHYDGARERDLYSAMTGERYADKQRQFIGMVATAIVKHDVLSEPVAVVFGRELAVVGPWA